MFKSEEGSTQTEFRLANIFSDGLVLQRAPHSPSVWGRNIPGFTVSLILQLFDDAVLITDPVVTDSDGVWSINVGSWPAGSGREQRNYNKV